MSLQTNNIYQFEDFRLDGSEKTLHRGEDTVPLTPKVFETLCVLVENAGHLIEKDVLMQKLWPDRFVEESNLTFNIKMLRRALGDNAQRPGFIETVQSRGYRFIAKVNVVQNLVTEPVTLADGAIADSSEPNADLAGSEPFFDAIAAPPAAKPRPSSRVFLFTIGFASAISLILLLSFNYRTASSLKPNEVKSIAVLPVKPLTADSSDPIYELGITDSLILDLSSVKGLIVRPLSATRQYADIAQDPIEAGKEQKVDYVLACSYQIADGKFRITSQLINVQSGLVEQIFKVELENANRFAVQNAVAADISRSLLKRLNREPNDLSAKRYTSNEEAYRRYLQGMILLDQRKAGKAIENLDQAVTLDPNYALAWAGLSRAHTAASFQVKYADAKVEYQKTKEAFTKALELDPNLSEAYSAICGSKLSEEYDLIRKESACRRALELNPNSPLAHNVYSSFLVGRGRFDEAIVEIKTAIDLDPTSYFNQRIYANDLYFARRYEEAVTQYKRLIDMDAGAPATYQWLIRTLEAQGNEAEAFEWYLRSLTLQKTEGRENQGAALNKTIQRFKTAYQRSGWHGVLLERVKNDTLHFRRAGWYARLGNKDKAFEYLERSYQEDPRGLSSLPIEPQFDSLRDDPRYADLVRRVRE